jgi:hypothetical protein
VGGNHSLFPSDQHENIPPISLIALGNIRGRCVQYVRKSFHRLRVESLP